MGRKPVANWYKKIIKVVFYILISILIIGIMAIYLFPIEQGVIYKPQASMVLASNGEVLRAFLSSDDKWRFWIPLRDVSPDLRRFVINYEDRWFYYHPGINPVAIIRATLQNIRSAKVISGGSTISMQIARMIEPKERNYKNKIIEILRALQLELIYSKNELLEIYFNLAPYGGNIEGIEAAARLYFGKRARELSYGEAALLAILPNNPENNRPDHHHERAVVARNKLLKRMLKYDILEDNEFIEARVEVVPNKRVKWPVKAPHLARKLHKEMIRENIINTTIDYNIQEKAELFLKEHIKSLMDSGISNGAVVIIDNNIQQLKALVGSADFFSQENEGQVNGALAARSPGSTLKPFIYALAMDQGLITPATYLEDVPINYAGYQPQNYDQSYHGIVSVREALKRSLNVPAVNLNNKMDNGQVFYDFLKEIDLSTIRDNNDYGLSMILGGCEITLLELTEMYAALANNGYYRKVQSLKGRGVSRKKKLLSSGTCYIISEILADITRPDMPRVWQFTDLPKVAWKTGTSYGHRDAWSVGYNRDYTIGIWIGNFDGRNSPYLIGSYAAAPLLFDLFNEISRTNSKKWFKKPSSVKTRMVCSLSGQLPNENCTSLIKDYYLTGISPLKKCELHKSISIDKESGYRLPPGNNNNKVKKATYIAWPPRVNSWRINNNYPIYKIPPLMLKGGLQVSGESPVIDSPVEGVTYYLRKDIPNKHQKIALLASVSADVNEIYWFIDGKLLVSVKPAEKFFYYPKCGRHRITCQDNLGRVTEIMIEIK